jgi:hypothetical protein
MKKLLLIPMLLLCMNVMASDAGELKSKQKKQENLIERQYKRKKITFKEYSKLMKEQESIQTAIKKYDLDGVWTPHELNVVHSKLERAEKRLQRYKQNDEVY